MSLKSSFHLDSDLICSVHCFEQASYFCLFPQCISQNPICVQCAFSTHKQHPVKPLKLLLKSIQSDILSIQQQQSLILFAKIDIAKENIFDIISGIQEKTTMNIVKQSLNCYLGEFMDGLNIEGILKLGEFLREGIDKLSVQKRKSIFKGMKQYLNRFGDPDLGQKQKMHKSNFSQLLGQKVKVLHQLSKILSQQCNSESPFTTISISEIFSHHQKKFTFSQLLKHPQIQLTSSKCAKMLGDYVSYNYMVLCVPPLSFQTKQSIKFSMISVQSYVSIGVCKQSILNKGYVWDSNVENHGTYQISFDGYCWCDGSTNNGLESGWSFNQGDQIQLIFDPVERNLRFQITSDPENGYDLGLGNLGVGEKVYFCVTMNTIPEEIHIID